MKLFDTPSPYGMRSTASQGGEGELQKIRIKLLKLRIYSFTPQQITFWLNITINFPRRLLVPADIKSAKFWEKL